MLLAASHAQKIPSSTETMGRWGKVKGPILQLRKKGSASMSNSLGPRFRDWFTVPSGYVKIAIENGDVNSGFTH